MSLVIAFGFSLESLSRLWCSEVNTIRENESCCITETKIEVKEVETSGIHMAD